MEKACLWPVAAAPVPHRSFCTCCSPRRLGAAGTLVRSPLLTASRFSQLKPAQPALSGPGSPEAPTASQGRPSAGVSSARTGIMLRLLEGLFPTVSGKHLVGHRSALAPRRQDKDRCRHGGHQRAASSKKLVTQGPAGTKAPGWALPAMPKGQLVWPELGAAVMDTVVLGRPRRPTGTGLRGTQTTAKAQGCLGHSVSREET